MHVPPEVAAYAASAAESLPPSPEYACPDLEEPDLWTQPRTRLSSLRTEGVLSGTRLEALAQLRPLYPALDTNVLMDCIANAQIQCARLQTRTNDPDLLADIATEVILMHRGLQPSPDPSDLLPAYEEGYFA